MDYCNLPRLVKWVGIHNHKDYTTLRYLVCAFPYLWYLNIAMENGHRKFVSCPIGKWWIFSKYAVWVCVCVENGNTPCNSKMFIKKMMLSKEKRSILWQTNIALEDHHLECGTSTIISTNSHVQYLCNKLPEGSYNGHYHAITIRWPFRCHSLSVSTA